MTHVVSVIWHSNPVKVKAQELTCMYKQCGMQLHGGAAGFHPVRLNGCGVRFSLSAPTMVLVKSDTL